MNIDRKITRTRDGRYCTVEIKLTDGRLSICGESGRIATPARARKEALESWRQFFDDSPEELAGLNKRCGTRFTSALSAARYVIKHDGAYHGLDAREAPDGSIHIGEMWGQCVDEIREWFPEVIPLLPWHLNDMKAGCEHQDELGWGNGKTIALDSSSLTDAQRARLKEKALAACTEKRNKTYEHFLVEFRENRQAAIKWLKSVHGSATLSEVEQLQFLFVHHNKGLENRLREDIAKAIVPEVFDAAIYKDSIGAPCPTCGYEYGTQWLRRELPAAIVELAATVCSDDAPQGAKGAA
jgi:hypothetical protein